MNSKKDIFGYDVWIDDEVAFNPPHFKGLTIGNVVSFTPKGFTVKFQAVGSATRYREACNVQKVVKHVYNGSTVSLGSHDEMS